MIISFIWYLVCFVLIINCGLIINHLISTRIRSIENIDLSIFNIYLAGFISLSILCSLGSILIPINEISFVLVYFFTSLFIAVVPGLRSNFNIFYSEFLKSIKANKTVIVLWLLFLLIVVSKEIFVFDSGNYHTQNIKWIREWSVVRGLGNLQPQLGFNPMFFPLSALFTLDFMAFGKKILIYPINAITYSIILLELLQRQKRYFSIDITKSAFFLAIFLISLLFVPFRISSPSPDIICTSLIIATIILFFENDRSTILPALILLLPTYKLSSVLVVILLGFWFIKNRTRTSSVIILVLALLIYFPFFVRNYYLTGYLIFPFAHIDLFDTVWKVPKSSVLIEYDVIKSWARQPNNLDIVNYPLSQWVPIWWKRTDILNQLLALSYFLPFLCIPLGLYFQRKKHLLLSVFLCATALFWFFNAPDVRFAFGFIFVSIGVFIFLVAHFFKDSLSKRRKLIFPLITVIWLLGILFFHRSHFQNIFKNPEQLLAPYSYSESQITYVESDDNISYFKSTHLNTCKNNPLPCSPRLTTPSFNILPMGEHLGDGFKVVPPEPRPSFLLQVEK